MTSNANNTTWSSKAWFSVGGPILGLAAGMMALALLMLWRFAAQEDRTFIASTQRLVGSAVEGKFTTLDSLAIDYGVWNDAYEAINVRWDRDFLENQYYSGVADALYVFREDGPVRYAWSAETFAESSEQLTAAVLDAARRSPRLAGSVRAPDQSGLLSRTALVVGGGLVLVSVSPVTPEDDAVRLALPASAPTDYLAVVDVLSAEELAAMGAQVGLDGLSFGGDPTHLDDAVSLQVPAAEGAEVGRLLWRNERPGSARFSDEWLFVLAALAAAAGVAAVVARRLAGRQIEATMKAQAAEEANRHKSEFVASMSHELRTPLNAIIGYAELLEEGDEPSPEMRQDLQRILAASRHLARLVNDVIDQARVDAGKLALNLEPLKVADLISEVRELAAPAAAANANRLIAKAPADIDAVMADHMRARQCLLNLTANAAKFTRGGSISVEARWADSGRTFVAIDVRDTGIGMTACEVKRLFQPFAQANASIQGRFGGTGLGLSISRKLARAMGGDITLVSTLGEGSTFTLTLPAAQVEDIADAA